jgi:hypothetical protein
MKTFFALLLLTSTVFAESLEGSYPILGCQECTGKPSPMATSEPHILSSVKMSNGSIGCSATVLGDPNTFRKYPKCLVASAAHCVGGKIGKEVTFYNPDGETSFQAKLLAFDRRIDASLFECDSTGPIGAVLMAMPGQFDQDAKFSSCNYPAASGGPNFKFCVFEGVSSRDGANLGHKFVIDAESRKHKGHFSGGGSGGGLFVQPINGDWLYLSATTHGGQGVVICTPQFNEMFAFVSEHCDKSDDCGPWCKKPPKRPGNPGGTKPPWYNPNVPVDPPKPVDPEEPAPPPPVGPDDHPAPPKPVEDPKVRELEVKVEQLQKQILDIKITAGIAGPSGKDGKDGTPGPVGPAGKDATIDLAAIKLQAEATARAAVDALVASGALKGPKGDPGVAGPKGDAGEARVEFKDKPWIVYFTSKNILSRTSESDRLAERLYSKGAPLVITTLAPSEINENNVRDVPRVFLLPERKSIVGQEAVVNFFNSLNP